MSRVHHHKPLSREEAAEAAAGILLWTGLGGDEAEKPKLDQQDEDERENEAAL